MKRYLFLQGDKNCRIFSERNEYEKGDCISNCIFDGHQFSDMRVCEGEGENLSGLFLEICGSCQNYIGLCRYVQGEKEPEGHCDCSQCGTWDERRFIGQNAVSSGWLCKGDRRNDSGRLCESSGGFRRNGISGRNGRT